MYITLIINIFVDVSVSKKLLLPIKVIAKQLKPTENATFIIPISH